MKIFDMIIALVLLTSLDSSKGHPQYMYKTPAIAFNESEGGAESTTAASASAIETTTTTEQYEIVETTPCCLKELARADVETTTGSGIETTATGQVDVTETTTGSGTETTTEFAIVETTATAQNGVTETTTGRDIDTTTEQQQGDDTETTTTITTTTGAEEPERTDTPTTTENVSSPKPQKTQNRTSGGKSIELPPEKIEEIKSSDSLRTKCRNQKVGPGRFKFICDGIRQDLITLQYEHILWLTNDGSGQVIDIEVPNYKINELIKAGYKTTVGSDTEINVLLKRPEQDANAEVDDLVVPVPSPAVSVLYEPPISQIIHFPTNKKYRALSGPILPPN
jgi:hypothetical protein